VEVEELLEEMVQVELEEVVVIVLHFLEEQKFH
jgi:hypothetical protein